jgi:archaellum component FlaG (FlaF/FlaG flagellin family)
VEVDKAGDKTAHSLSAPGHAERACSEKAEALTDSLEAQFQPVNDPSDPAVIEMVGEALRLYSYAPTTGIRSKN